MALANPLSIALVLPGEAMWGALQTGFAFELGGRLQRQGWGEHPFDVAIGSSSGSLIATGAAAGGPFDHDLGREGWIEFGRATRFFQRGGPLNPYPGALQRIFESGLVDTDRAYRSPTHLIVTASDYHAEAVSRLGRDHFRLFLAGARLLLAGEAAADREKFDEIGASLLDDGRRIFGTRYYATKAAPVSPYRQEATLSEAWRTVESPEQLRRAVEASSRVPLLYGNPVLDGVNVMIDGVFTNNAPVELALEHGARHVFVVTSSKKGYVFDRPVQTLFRRQLRGWIGGLGRLGRGLRFVPGTRHAREMLEALARMRDMVPKPAPLDLDDLRRRYPGREIHVVHPPQNIRVNRFFESDPRVLGRLYDLGRELADRVPELG